MLKFIDIECVKVVFYFKFDENFSNRDIVRRLNVGVVIIFDIFGKFRILDCGWLLFEYVFD